MYHSTLKGTKMVTIDNIMQGCFIKGHFFQNSMNNKVSKHSKNDLYLNNFVHTTLNMD